MACKLSNKTECATCNKDELLWKCPICRRDICVACIPGKFRMSEGSTLEQLDPFVLDLCIDCHKKKNPILCEYMLKFNKLAGDFKEALGIYIPCGRD